MASRSTSIFRVGVWTRPTVRDTDEVLATVSNKRLEKAVDVKVNLIGVDKLRVKAGRISDDNNFEFGYNGGYLYNLYLTPITQK